MAEPIGSSVLVRAHHFPVPTEPVINTPHNPSTDILHSLEYEDGTESEFRNVGN